ncbi:MAG: alcohol dehydrogenase, partial [Paracoccaceae bacterium]
EALRETGYVPERFAEVRAWIAGALGGEAVNAFATLAGWIDAQGLPGLVEMGVEPARHRAIAEASASSSSMKGNPIPLSAEVLVRVMERS